LKRTSSRTLRREVEIAPTSEFKRSVASDVRLYREPEAARDSARVELIASRHIATPMLLSHIRHATRGPVMLANTQPFTREIGGRMHCFAHNGQLTFERSAAAEHSMRFQPIGQTDSEQAACRLFARMGHLHDSASRPSLADRRM
jgi:predicted glutamine amidotransferase